MTVRIVHFLLPRFPAPGGLRQVIGVASVTAENPAGESVFHDTRHIQHLVQDPSISIGKHDDRLRDGWQVRKDGYIEISTQNLARQTTAVGIYPSQAGLIASMHRAFVSSS